MDVSFSSGTVWIKLDAKTRANVNGAMTTVDQIELFDGHAHVVLNAPHEWWVALAKRVLDRAEVTV